MKKPAPLINDLLDIEKIEMGKMDFAMQRQPLLPIVEQAVESADSLITSMNEVLNTDTRHNIKESFGKGHFIWLGQG
mgnify:CR=1 FL=1